MKNHPQSDQSTAKDRHKPALTTRQHKIVTLVVAGFKNKEIAQRMSLSEEVVKTEFQKIFSKLGVCDRLELAFYAVDNKLVPIRNKNRHPLPPGRAAQSTSLQEILDKLKSKPR